MHQEKDLEMIEISVRIGPEAFEHGQFVYVWLDGGARPIYVGETGKSPSDRAGLHIRDSSRSGAIVGTLMKTRPQQQYTVLAFPVSESLLAAVAKENTPAHDTKSRTRARKAIERVVFELLSHEFSGMHKGRGCSWKAKSADSFAEAILSVCRARAKHAAA